jgi:hypothetical protein
LGDEYGWKQVHGDVFRSASYPLLFSSLVGTGYQLAVVGFLVIIMSIVGDLYTEYVLCVFIGYLFISSTISAGYTANEYIYYMFRLPVMGLNAHTRPVVKDQYLLHKHIRK